MVEKELSENDCFLIAKDMLSRFGKPAPYFTGFYYSNHEDVKNWRNPWNFIRQSAISLNLIIDEEIISSKSFGNILEIYWSFITNGILVPDSKFNSSSSNKEHEHKTFERLRLTKFGKKIVQESLPPPHQTDEFVKEIKENSIPIFNDIVEIYLKESLKCFNLKLNLASMFLLGDAVEQLFRRFVSFFNEKCVESNIQGEFRLKFESFRIDKLISEFKKIIQRNENKLKNYSIRHYRDWLSAFDEIRVDRNDIGHANRSYFDKNIIYGYYLRLRHILRELKNLIEDFKNNKLSEI